MNQFFTFKHDLPNRHHPNLPFFNTSTTIAIILHFHVPSAILVMCNFLKYNETKLHTPTLMKLNLCMIKDKEFRNELQIHYNTFTFFEIHRQRM